MNVCSICSAGPFKRNAINASIVQGLSNQKISLAHQISESSIQRHKTNCIPNVVAKVKADDEAFTAENLMRILNDVRNKAMDIFERNNGVDDAIALKALQRVDNTIQTSVKIAEVIAKTQARSGNAEFSNARVNALKEKVKQLRLAGPQPSEVIDIKEIKENDEN